MLTSSIDINRYRQMYYYCQDISASVESIKFPRYSYVDLNSNLNWGMTGSVEIINHSGSNSYNGALMFSDTVVNSTTQGAIPDMINAGQILKLHFAYDSESAGVGNKPNNIKYFVYDDNDYHNLIYSSSNIDFSGGRNYLDPVCFFYEDKSLSNCVWSKISNESENANTFIADKLTISIIAMGHRENIN